MNFFADECVYPSTVAALRSWHHSVETAQDAGLLGQDDPVLLAHAVQRGQILVTNDLDFGDIRHYPPPHHCGVIVLRIRPRTADRVHAVLQRFLETMTQEEMQGTLAIVDAIKYRVRRG
jgi:predicted nuclease of predicted toxin-antitoxin system